MPSPWAGNKNVKKWKMGGVFCKKIVENGECFCEKKWTFFQCRVHYVHYVQYQYFLFYILLIWGVHAHSTPTGLK